MRFILLLLCCVMSALARPSLRILGGRDAAPGEYPYVVRLELQMTLLKANTNDPDLIQFKHVCTGAALTSIWTITAAHCLGLENYENENQQIKDIIRYGDLTNLREGIVDILSTFIYPGYKHNSSPKLKQFFHDFGLVRSQPMKLTQFARLSALDPSTLLGLDAKMVGFGIMGMHDSKPVITLHLKKPLQVSQILIIKCPEKSRKLLVPALCVSYACSHPSALCPGDSGGPLLHASGIVGVNSMTSTNCVQNENLLKRKKPHLVLINPTVFYIDWIAKIVNESTT